MSVPATVLTEIERGGGGAVSFFDKYKGGDRYGVGAIIFLNRVGVLDREERGQLISFIKMQKIRGQYSSGHGWWSCRLKS